MKITIKYKLRSARKYTPYVNKVFQNAIKRAAGQLSYYIIKKIPIYTGFLSGAFYNLESVTGFVQRHKPKSSKILRSDKNRFGGNYVKGKYYEKILKTPESGRNKATQPDEIFKSDGKGLFIFTYDVDIKYFFPNDNYTMPTVASAPWFSVRKGKQEFERSLKTSVRNLKLLEEFEYVG